MSKENGLIFLAALIFLTITQLSLASPAQIVEAKIKIRGETPEVIEIQGVSLDANRLENKKNLSFMQSHAGVENLGERILQVELSDENKQKIEHRKLAAGEFLVEKPFVFWNYAVVTKMSASSAARISWVSGEQGILMTADLLPQFNIKRDEKISARISFDLPKDWKIISTEKKLTENVFEASDIEKAIFYVGKNWREREISDGGAGKLNFIISGERQFSDEEAFQMASEIFGFYEKLFGAAPFQNTLIFLGKFPEGAGFGRWEAETRGASITIFSAEMPFKTQSAQRLHEQLRHEIFHLWMPNNLNLSGNYDWFYEGFAVYQALKMGVAVNRLRFEDFLDTLGRAASIDNLQSGKSALVEVSKNRWNGAVNTQVYARGMLVAFLCDLAVLNKSKGKNSIADVLREIYAAHSPPNSRAEANSAILKILARRAELQPIIKKYVEGAENIVWKTDLEIFGIESAEENFQTVLRVKAKPSDRQKDLLNKLGYNNWRRLSGGSR